MLFEIYTSGLGGMIEKRRALYYNNNKRREFLLGSVPPRSLCYGKMDRFDPAFERGARLKIKQLKGMPKAARRNALRMASLFLIFALLSSLFYIPCYLYIRTITRRNAVEYYQQKLEDGLRSLDTSLTALSNLQILLNGDERYRAISYLNADSDPAVLSALRSIVSTYLVPYDAVADAGVSQGDDLLFTRRRIYYKRDALRQHPFFACEGLSVEAYLRQFQEARCILPAQQFYSADYGKYEAFTVAWL